MKKYKLKDVLQINNGIDCKNLETGFIPVYGSGGYMKSINKFLYDGEAILLPRKGSLNNIMYVNEKFWTIDTMYWTKVNNNIANIYYLYNLLKILKLFGTRSGSTLPSMTSTAYYNITIKLPDMDIQNKIAKILQKLDNKIELNNKINKELEEMAKDLYNYWFVQFDFPDENKRPYKSSGGKMVYNDVLKREIPVGWEALSLEKRLNMKRGTEFGSNKYVEDKSADNNFVKFYRVGDMDDSGSTYISVKLSDIKLLNTSDLAVSFDGSVGRIAIGLSGAYSSGIRKITDKKNIITTGTLFFIFNDKEIQDTIHKYATGSNILHASASIPYLFIAYNEKTFLNFQTKIMPIFNLLLKNKLENKKLTNLRDFLLPMLMNGQVSII